MKKILKALLYVVGGVLLTAAIFAIVVAVRGIPKYEVKEPTLQITYTPQRVERGANLAANLCKSCHYNSETRHFTGRLLVETKEFGEIYVKNITQDKVAGIGNWTDGQLVYFLRTGVRPDGQYVPPYMPKLAHISDEDMYSIIAFLRSDNEWVKADNTREPESKPSFIAKLLTNLKVFAPFPYPDKPIPGPDTSNMVELGKYIALNQVECYACHSQDFKTNDYNDPAKSKGFFGGGNKLLDMDGKELHSLNLTMDEQTCIGKWSEDDFVKAVRFGQVPDGGPALRYPMLPYVNLSEKEVRAIYAYLKTVPTINNKVERKL